LSAPAVYVGTILRMKTMTTEFLTRGSLRATNQAVDDGITVSP